MGTAKYDVTDVKSFAGKPEDGYPEKGICIYWEGNSMVGEYVLNWWKDGRITANTERMDWADGKPTFLKKLLRLMHDKYPDVDFSEIEDNLDKIEVKN